MSGEIKKIDTIRNMAVFQDFRWASSVRDEGNNVAEFKKINILYGRNYSGKTTLSRILRAMETGELSDKFENPSFVVTFVDGTQTTQSTPTAHDKKIRVFNEDFVRDNLRFITNPDDSIEPFAILGDDNNKIEKEIEALESELGSKEEGKETGLYAQRVKASREHAVSKDALNKAQGSLDNQLKTKSTDKKIGIRYKPERFGNQNYDIRDIKSDIGKVQNANYQPPTDEKLAQYEKLITEKTLQPISPFHVPSLNTSTLANKAEALVTKKISESNKIDELVKDAVLNRWVNEGRAHHKNKRDNCAFCDNPITEDRWTKLEKHFDEESEKLEKDIDAVIARIDAEKDTVSSALSIDKSSFYSRFHNKLDELDKTLRNAISKYEKSLDAMTAQLKARKNDILNQKSFKRPDDASDDLVTAWNSYDAIRKESDSFSNSLSTEQTKAKQALRLKEISDYLVTIRYQELLSSIEDLESKHNKSEQEKNRIEEYIRQKEGLVASKKRELNDEEKGAKKVNDYLNNFFGHQFLSLEAKKEKIPGEDSRRIRFEVIRDGKKAYHLSEGECSLIAFCYFMAKLEDVETKGNQTIIWIDDPISSLDANHIFFVYSLINAEIVKPKKYVQLFISTHNLDFLKYLKRISNDYKGKGEKREKIREFFLVERSGDSSRICLMPGYLKNYVTEFNYLFHQIYKCAIAESIDDGNYHEFYNFGNNARKFLEIYLYYRYPNGIDGDDKLLKFFGEDSIPAIFTDRVNNEYSHLCGGFERGASPIEVPEMKIAAQQIISKIKEDTAQYSALLQSIGVKNDLLDTVFGTAQEGQ
ncbi:conserved hypothetical protein [Nitrosomonas nitrosa]|uniref:Protein CR006 P-loop domain-containing protein n=1 Tax=Nitrosomonas nitrosa TaxID=52442 RepID=A0A8H9DAF1_9PROT|nr:AAA family ATPase [Nitrosomonas nitrosa]CAE6519196.1 conserved hypothetical protein [Nitrosomonas nitrosa]